VTRLLHLSDPHFGAVDVSIADRFLARAVELAPHLTILSGDLTMRARHRELADSKAFVDQLPVPHLVIPGNHDIPLLDLGLERFFNPFKRFRATFGADLEPELIIQDVHVVSLNSSRAYGLHADWSEGRLSKRQLADMVRKFTAGPTPHLRVLVLHHPLLELQVAGRAVVKPLRELLEALEAARVDLVMCGHFHRSQLHAVGLTDHWKALISQAPTVCSTRLQGEPQGFHEFHVSGDHIEVIHHIYQRGEFVPAESIGFERAENGWSSAPSKKNAR
jgi:3',5'-cyclic AMP phosphodiesterase CpdA